MSKEETTKNVWVTTHGDQWAVKIAGDLKDSYGHDSRKTKG